MGRCFPAKTLVLALAGIIVPAVWAADVTVPAGETLTITDFAAVSYGGVDCEDGDVITLNAGCTIKIAAGVANAGTFQQHVKLLGDATLDLTDYDAEMPFRLYRSVYTASPDTFKLTVVQGADKRFWCGGGGAAYSSYTNTQIPTCMISKGALVLPTDVDLHFTGCTALYHFPSEIENISYECNTSLATSAEGYQPSILSLGTNIFGTDPGVVVVTNFQLVVKDGSVNASQSIRVTKAAKGTSYGGGHYLKGQNITQTGIKSVSMSGATIRNDIELAGGVLWARGGGITYTGRVTGQGTIATMGYGQIMYLKGELAATNVSCTLGQRGTWIYFQNSAITEPITQISISHNDNIGNASSYGGGHGYYFQLQGYDTQPTYVPIKTVAAQKIANNLGGTIYVYGQQTLDIGTLKGSYARKDGGGLRIVDSTKGQTQINVGTFSTALELLLSTNTCITVTNLASGISPKFNYYSAATGINRTKLEFINGSNAGTEIVGASPSVLPRRIVNHAGTVAVGAGTTTPAWTVLIDPTDADPVINGCEGSGALTVPASGTIEIVNTTGDSLPGGLYPILTCTTGGAALSASAWPVTLTGWRQANLEVLRGETGIWLKVSKGTMVLLR
ncbi:MAG: hypothetical protein Q4G65_11565 [bacterium]|nr:hypothetical protein [bacterium]